MAANFSRTINANGSTEATPSKKKRDGPFMSIKSIDINRLLDLKAWVPTRADER